MKQVRMYARWLEVSRPDFRNAASEAVKFDLIRWCRDNLLTLDESTIRVHVSTGAMSLPPRCVVLAEGKAAGTDPATRHVKGWRGLLRAP